jgi:hypothetical protein
METKTGTPATVLKLDQENDKKNLETNFVMPQNAGKLSRIEIIHLQLHLKNQKHCRSEYTLGT